MANDIHGFSGVLLLGVTLCACSGLRALRLPPEFPRYQIDVEASQVEASSIADANALKSIVAEEMQQWSQPSNDKAATMPARFRARVRQTVDYWPTAACVGVYVVFGCPSHIHKVEVSLDFDVGGQLFQGTGLAKRVGGLYYEQQGTEAVRSALREAMNRAFERNPE